MFPKTKAFKAVEADKTAFPMTNFNSPSRSAKKGGAPIEENTPVAASYNDMFKLKNMQAVRHSFLPGKMQLSYLQEASNLRCIKSKPITIDHHSDEEHESATKSKGSKKK